MEIKAENDELVGRYAEIKTETANDNYISIIVKDGNIIDYDDDGTYLGSFEKDEQYAHHLRLKVLNE